MKKSILWDSNGGYRFNKTWWFHVLIIIALCLIVYSNSLKNNFFYDDFVIIVENSLIRDLRNIPSFFFSSIASSTVSLRTAYRPITMVSFAINYKLFGLNVLSYHVVNILFHTANAILVYFFVLMIIAISPHGFTGKKSVPNKYTLALFISLIFSVHPANSEAVNYIWQRSVLMATSFYLSALILFLKHLINGRKSLLVVSLFCYIFALLSKEIAITLPLILILMDWYYISNNNGNKLLSSLRKHHYPFLVISVTFVFIRFVLQNTASVFNAPGKASSLEYFLTQFMVVINYLRILVFPCSLSVAHNFPIVESFANIQLLLSIFIIVFIVCISIYLSKSLKIISSFILWFFIALIPTSSILPLRIIMNEHRLYLPSIGLFIAGVFILYRVILQKFYQKHLSLLLSATVILFSILTINRNYDWNNSVKLWSEVLNNTPHSEEALNNRGNMYLREGLLDEALMDFNEVIKMNPDYPIAYSNRGHIYSKMKEYNKAINDFEYAIKLDPDLSGAYFNRGIVYEELGIYDKAIEDYSKEVRLNPYSSRHFNRRGAVYLKTGSYDKAMLDLNKAIELDNKNGKAFNDRGCLFKIHGDYKSALNDFNTAISICPDLINAYNHRGIVYGITKKYDESIKDFTKSIQLDNNNARAYNNRGSIYKKQGNIDRAHADFKEALRINPEFVNACSNLAAIYAIQGNYNKAIDHINRAIDMEPGNINLYKNRKKVYLIFGRNELAKTDENIINNIKNQQ